MGGTHAVGVVGEEEEQTFCREEEYGYITESSSGGCTDTEGVNGVGNYNANVREVVIYGRQAEDLVKY